jgi:hypothetical protein
MIKTTSGLGPVLFCTLVALTLTACGKAKTAPREYPVAEGFFFVTVPGNMEVECRNQKTAAGIEGQACVGATSATRMVVASAKLPGEADSSKLDQAFKTAMSNAAASLDSSVAFSKDVEVYGVPGKDFRLKTLYGNANGRMFIGNGYLVMALAVAKRGEPDSDEIPAFAASLRPIKPK